MKFIDEATISVHSGHGGRGCVSFRREKFIPRGGPNGGDGGRGGDVILCASAARRTLLQFQYRREFRAPNGAPGQGQQRTGKSGRDLVIEVAPGTLIQNAETGERVADLLRPGDAHTVCRGGRGGQGNARFKSSTHRTPRFAQPGEAGESHTLKLELKLLADVGLIGLPNAGKSTLIGAVSAARPKIADYPFTTLTPTLGVVQPGGGEPFVMADIPGLIAGAHLGTGLGTQFLRHVERTRVLVHLVDAAAIDSADPLDAYRTINHELAMYGAGLADKPQIVALNKLDVAGAQEKAECFRRAVDRRPVLSISALTRQGLRELIGRVAESLCDGGRDG